jgi:hypothetical protein
MSKILKALKLINQQKSNNNKVAIETLNIIYDKNIKIRYLSRLTNIQRKMVISQFGKDWYKNMGGLYLTNTNYIFVNSRVSVEQMARTIVHEINHVKHNISPFDDTDVFMSELLAHKAEIEFSGKLVDKNNLPEISKNIINNYKLFTALHTKN